MALSTFLYMIKIRRTPRTELINPTFLEKEKQLGKHYCFTFKLINCSFLGLLMRRRNFDLYTW